MTESKHSSGLTGFQCICPPVELGAAHEYSGCSSVIRSHTCSFCLSDGVTALSGSIDTRPAQLLPRRLLCCAFQSFIYTDTCTETQFKDSQMTHGSVSLLTHLLHHWQGPSGRFVAVALRTNSAPLWSHTHIKRSAHTKVTGSIYLHLLASSIDWYN